MGTFVDKLAVGTIEMPAVVPEAPGTNFEGNINPSSPWTIVSNRFTESSDIATEFLDLVTGPAGYLSDLAAVVDEFPKAEITDITYSEILPANIEDALVWYEAAFNDTLYNTILAKLTNDLVNGSTGVGGTIVQDIYDNALARQLIEEDKLQAEIEERLSSTGFDLPTGALASALQEHSNARAMRTLDMNQKISIDEANLAQQNSQFAITAATNLDTMMRNFVNSVNSRSLDYKKAVAAHIIASYELYLKDAGNVLLAKTSASDMSVKGYQAEYALRSEVAKALVAAAMQAFASSFGAVSANAGIQYSGSESVSESFAHNESKSHTTGVSLSGTVSAGVSNTLNESHDYKE